VPNVILKQVRSEQQVPYNYAVSWRLYLKGILKGEAAGQAVGGGAYAANALGQIYGIPGISPLKNLFNSPEKDAARVRIHHLALFDFYVNAPKTIESGYRTYDFSWQTITFFEFCPASWQLIFSAF